MREMKWSALVLNSFLAGLLATFVIHLAVSGLVWGSLSIIWPIIPLGGALVCLAVCLFAACRRLSRLEERVDQLERKLRNKDQAKSEK